MKYMPTHIAANQLMAALPSADCTRLLAQCEMVELTFAEVLYRAGDTMSYVYFPTAGFISMIESIAEHEALEVGLVGHEGMVGITALLGIDQSPFQAMVQGAGSALRIKLSLFRHELAQSPALLRQLQRYLYVWISQLAQTAACTRFHLVEERLARWLLMTRDRAQADQFHITHVFIAYMLGVRRVGITKAANALLNRKLITYQRGAITILDPFGLESAACSCYQADKTIYKQYLHTGLAIKPSSIPLSSL